MLASYPVNIKLMNAMNMISFARHSQSCECCHNQFKQ